MKTPKDITRFVELLRKEWGGDFVSAVLFGSYASGKASADSDIDLLLIHRQPSSGRFQRHEVVFDLAKKISEEFANKLSAILLGPLEAQVTKPYYLDMTIHCEILFDQKDFFKNILTRLKHRLKTYGSKRVFDSQGNPYWILKANAEPGEEITL